MLRQDVVDEVLETTQEEKTGDAASDPNSDGSKDDDGDPGDVRSERDDDGSTVNVRSPFRRTHK